MVLSDDAPGLVEAAVEVDHAIDSNGIRNALDLDVAALLAMDLVLHVGMGLVRDQDGARPRLVLETRGEVRCAADDRVIHPVFTAEVTDGAIARADSHSRTERLLDASFSPDALELAHPLLHRDSHLHAGERVLPHTSCLRIA